MLGTLAALSLFAVAANGLILMVLLKNRLILSDPTLNSNLDSDLEF